MRQRGEAPDLAPRLDDRLGGALPHPLDRRQPDPDRVALDGERQPGGVDVGTEDPDARAAQDRHVGRQLLGVGGFRGQHRRPVVERVVRLQVRGLIRDVRVGDGVRLVEPVLGEGHDLAPQRLDLGLRVAARDAAGDEVLALLVDELLDLLAHRLAQRVGAPQREAGDPHGDAHHLLLVHDHAVGLGEDLLELGEDVGDRPNGRACGRRSPTSTASVPGR